MSWLKEIETGACSSDVSTRSVTTTRCALALHMR
jgi:hypothetical protein